MNFSVINMHSLMVTTFSLNGCLVLFIELIHPLSVFQLLWRLCGNSGLSRWSFSGWGCLCFSWRSFSLLTWSRALRGMCVGGGEVGQGWGNCSILRYMYIHMYAYWVTLILLDVYNSMFTWWRLQLQVLTTCFIVQAYPQVSIQLAKWAPPWWSTSLKCLTTAAFGWWFIFVQTY